MKSQTIDFKRQVLLFNPRDFEDKTVAVVGLGNIGSHTALALARLGIQNFFLYDYDVVEPHNLASQCYSQSQVNKFKSSAIRESILEINKDAVAIAFQSRFDPRRRGTVHDDMLHADIVIIAVDSMKARKRISEMYRTAHWPNLLIDARIGGNQLEVYNIRTWDEWQKTFSDNPSTDPCGGRYISYVSLIVAGVIVNQVKKFLREEPMDQSIVVDANSLQVIKNISWK